MEAGTTQHPIGLIVTDDLHRSRLTVFFRLLLALPHLIWVSLWGIVAAVLDTGLAEQPATSAVGP